LENIAEVVDNGLCCRCGTCIGVCPQADCIRLDEKFYPLVDLDLCNSCGLCVRVCPGKEVDFPQMFLRLFERRIEDYLDMGYFSQAFVGYIKNQVLRVGASSGGLVTGLLISLLENQIIDGAIITTMRKDRPWMPTTIIARTKEEIIEGAGSKYVVTPVNQIIGLVENLSGQYALVGLSCHIHGCRKAFQQNKRLSEKIRYLIGLFCSTTLEPEATLDLFRISAIVPSEISKLEYRGGNWPGAIRVIQKDGTIKKLHPSNFKDGAINYLTKLYAPQRCRYCIDGSNEFADISVSDAWTRDCKGDYIYNQGYSLVLVRNRVGQYLMESIQDDPNLYLEKVSQEIVYNTHLKELIARKKRVGIRIEDLKKKAIPFPNYYLPCPNFSLRDKLSEYFFSLLSQWATRFPRQRYLLLKTLVSKMGIPLIIFRQLRKKGKYKAINI
jgi:coenzyme F420 hydrogenase subunit beta